MHNLLISPWLMDSRYGLHRLGGASLGAARAALDARRDG